MWDAALRARFVERAGRLTADATPAWGKFNVSGMLAHLNDSYRMCLGELKVAPKNIPLKYTPIKQLVIYVLPFPKGAPTAPELIARCGAASFLDEQTALAAMLARLGSVRPTDPLQEHPAFGRLSYNQYGALMARHTDHHLRQFGV